MTIARLAYIKALEAENKRLRGALAKIAVGKYDPDAYNSGIASEALGLSGNEIWDRAEAEDERHARMSGPEAV